VGIHDRLCEDSTNTHPLKMATLSHSHDGFGFPRMSATSSFAGALWSCFTGPRFIAACPKGFWLVGSPADPGANPQVSPLFPLSSLTFSNKPRVLLTFFLRLRRAPAVEHRFRQVQWRSVFGCLFYGPVRNNISSTFPKTISLSSCRKSQYKLIDSG